MNTIYKRANRPPQMIIHQSMWSMTNYGTNHKEWSLEEKFEKIAESGFDGIFASLPDPSEEKQWRRLMEQYNFSFGLESFPNNREDLRRLLERAKDFEVQYVNAQVGNSFVIGDEAVILLENLIEEAALSGIPFFVETHRGRITQDLLRTIEYVNRIPNLRLTIDFSHYVLAGEMGAFQTVEPYFEKLLKRTSSIHGRVTNGQQIQIDIGDGEHPSATPFKNWWEKGMRYWLQQAKDNDFFPFVCEIGHHYTMTPSGLPSKHSDEEKLTDRWQQSLVFKRIAENNWNNICNGNKC
ncbi:TIM barrel protein [Neobacillus drentensis]|uniref:sugar phosphate isomerase/epimerase family protein n=1 Tax=Neobacillus drentensis TaxID=220684 RepID=UPI003000EED9